MDTHKISFRKLINNSLARNSAIVFAGSMAGNVLAYVYHLLMGRLLGPAGYGEFSSLVSIFYIFSVPLVVASTVLVKFISGFKARHATGQAKSLFRSATKSIVVISLIGLPVMLGAAPWVTSFLHLSSWVLFMLIYLTFVMSLLSIAPASLLQGYQRFVWVSIFAVVMVAVKIFFSVPMAVWGVYGVLSAAALAATVTYLLYYIPLGFVLRAKSEKISVSKHDAFLFALPALLIQLGITSLYTTDIILVRHFFPAPEAGLYAALAILGKIIFYASSAVSIVLFPVLAERTASGGATKKLTASAVVGVSAVSAGITALYFLFPDVIVRMLFGTAYTGAGSYLGLFGVFLALFSVGGIITTACLAMGKTGVWFVPAACAILQIAGITVWHGSIGTVITLNIGVCVLYVLGSAAYYLKVTYAKI